MIEDDVETVPGLAGRAVRGAAASSFGSVGLVAVQLLSLVVLARLLSPGDFGLFAMVFSVVGVAELFREFGLSTASIQARELSDQQRTNLWWLNTAAGATASILVVAAAKPLGILFGRDEVAWLAVALAPTFLLSGMASQYRAHLIRTMRFGAVAATDVAAITCGVSAAVVLAAGGAGAFALVVQNLVAGAVSLVMLAAWSGWLPGAYRRATRVGQLIRFGLALLGSQLVTYLSVNLDSIVVGRVFGAVDLGFYNRGMQLIRTPMNQLRAPVATVALPVLSALQGRRDRYLEFVERGQLVTGLPVCLGVGAFVVSAPGLVEVVLGPGWVPAVDVMRFIAVGEALSTLMFVASWMFVTLGLGRELVRFSVATLAIRIGLILIGLHWGLLGVAAAYAGGPLIAFPLCLWRVARATGLDTRRLGRQAVLIVALTVSVTGATWLAVAHSPAGGPVGSALLAIVTQLALVATAAAVPQVRRLYVAVRDTARELRPTG